MARNFGDAPDKPKRRGGRNKPAKLSFDQYWFLDFELDSEEMSAAKQAYSPEADVYGHLAYLVDDGFKFSMSRQDGGTTWLVSLTCTVTGHPDAGGVLTARASTMHKAIWLLYYKCTLLDDAGGWRAWKDSVPDPSLDLF